MTDEVPPTNPENGAGPVGENPANNVGSTANPVGDDPEEEAVSTTPSRNEGSTAPPGGENSSFRQRRGSTAPAQTQSEGESMKRHRGTTNSGDVHELDAQARNRATPEERLAYMRPLMTSLLSSQEMGMLQATLRMRNLEVQSAPLSMLADAVGLSTRNEGILAVVNAYRTLSLQQPLSGFPPVGVPPASISEGSIFACPAATTTCAAIPVRSSTWDGSTVAVDPDLTLDALFEPDPLKAQNALQLTAPFPDPASSDNDWLSWCARAELSLSSVSHELQNYVLLARAGSEYNYSLRERRRRDLRTMPCTDLIEHLGKAVYRGQNRDPLVIAVKELAVGRFGVRDRKDLFRRIIRLCYCQWSCPTDEQFVLTMLSAFLRHMDDFQSSQFLMRVERIYPTLMDHLRGDAEPTLSSLHAQRHDSLRLTPGARPFPRSAEDIRLYANILLTEAVNEGYEGRAKSNMRALMAHCGAFDPPPTSTSLTPQPTTATPPSSSSTDTWGSWGPQEGSARQQRSAPREKAKPRNANPPRQQQHPRQAAPMNAPAPQAAAPAPKPARSSVCFACQGHGHMARDCPTRANAPATNAPRSTAVRTVTTQENQPASSSATGGAPSTWAGTFDSTDSNSTAGTWSVPFEKFENSNCPGFLMLVGDYTIPVLFDTGSEFTYCPDCFLHRSMGLDVRSLRTPLVCGSVMHGTGDAVTASNEKVKLKPTVSNVFVMLNIAMWGFCFSFPACVMQMATPIIILGTDFMTRLGLRIHMDTSRLVLTCPSALMKDVGAFQQYMSARGSQMGLEYSHELEKGKSHCECRTTKCFVIGGTPLCTCEHPLVPTRRYFIRANVPVKIVLRVKTLMMRETQAYRIHLRKGLTRFRKSSLVGDKTWVEWHNQRDTDLLEVIVVSEVDLQLTKESVVGVVIPGITTTTNAICLTPYAATEEAEVQGTSPSSFKVQQVYDDFPIPAYGQPLPVVRDYNEEERAEAWNKRDKLRVWEEGRMYLTPKPGVKIPVEPSAIADEKQLLLLGNMLANLPDGVWSQEHPDRLPGVPMDDLVVRVKLTTDRPVYRKARYMNEQERQRAITQLQAEMQLGLFEPANSPYSCNITWAQKESAVDASRRLCINYQPLNDITEADKYPLPRCENVMRNLAGKRYLSLVDLRKGFNNLYVHPADRKYLAFSSPVGQLQPIRLPFGWKNGPPAFQRMIDDTLQELRQFFSAYIDDLSGGVELNQRQHDLLLCTILWNCWRRGLVFHADKAQLLREALQLVGMRVDGKGVLPSIMPGLFERLQNKRHTCLKHVQSTLGALNWFRSFVPSFSYIVRPLMKYLKSEFRNGEAIQFSPDCIEAIRKVGDYVKSAPSRVHPIPDREKYLHIAVGSEAYSVLFAQDNGAGGTELIEFWSKRWAHRVESYQSYEMVALALREAIKQFHADLHASGSIVVRTNDRAFNNLAKSKDMWDSRMLRYMVHTEPLNIRFSDELEDRDRYTAMLVQHIDDTPISDNKIGLTCRIMSFFKLDSDRIANAIPRVHTDGGCRRGSKGRIGGLGVFWENGSVRNLSKRAERLPVTNQSAELEAIVVAIEQAIQLEFTQLVLFSDSAYAVNCLTDSAKSWTIVERPDEQTCDVTCRHGDDPKNGDLFGRILWLTRPKGGIKVMFIHVRREYNQGADQLASEAIGGSRSVKVATVQTRSSQRLSQGATQDTDPATSAPSRPYGVPPPEFWDSGDDFDLIIWDKKSDLDENEDPHPVTPDSSLESEPDLEGDDDVEMAETPESEPSEDEAASIPDSSGPPRWTMGTHLNPARKTQGPAVLKLSPPNVKELLTILTLLPGQQREDPVLGPLFNALTNGDAALTAAQRRALSKYSLSPETKCLVQKGKYGEDRIVVPTCARIPLLTLFHQSLVFGGHSGCRATTTHILRYFVWEGLYADVENYCRNCSVCKEARANHGKALGMLTMPPIPSGPFARVHLDSIYGLPRGVDGRRYILVVMCSFSKYIFAEAVTRLTARSIIIALTSIFTRFGQPGLVVSDNGSEFKSEELSDFLTQWGVQWMFSSPHNPQANGQAEAGVKIVSRRLRSMVHGYIKQSTRKTTQGLWPRILPYAEMTYNHTPNDITGFSPYELVFGKTPPLPIRIPDMPDELTKASANDHVNFLRMNLEEFNTLASSNLVARQEAMEKQYNRFRSALMVKPGDWVYVTHPYDHQIKKLDPRAYGPFKVTRAPTNAAGHVMWVECLCKEGAETEEKPKIFPRRRIRPVDATLPGVEWEQLNAQATLDPEFDPTVPDYPDAGFPPTPEYSEF